MKLLSVFLSAIILSDYRYNYFNRKTKVLLNKKRSRQKTSYVKKKRK